ncbi:MAG: CNNM domain-containing protein [Phycisphaerales bacterium]|jgi:CBS domain containing-hemolysin-like protein|nr:CNNM domain-containing protein [Phycisphaerales bacterium]
MTSLELTLLLCALGAGILGSALFSGLEMGLYSINRVRLELRVGRGDGRARILGSLLRRPQKMLAVILIGTNAANQLGTWSVATLLHGSGFGPIAVIVIDTVLLVPLLLILAEVLPKDLFRTRSDDWCYRLARPLRLVELLLTVTLVAPLTEWFGRAMARLVRGGDPESLTARQRMSDLLKEGVDAGVLSVNQTALLDRALRMRYRTVGDVMVPWRDVHAIAAAASPDERRAAIDSRWSRMPVVETDGGVRSIVSIIALYTRPDEPLTDCATDARMLNPDTPASEALLDLRSHQAAIGVVQGPAGPPLGIVTVKDLVAPLIAAEGP